MFFQSQTWKSIHPPCIYFSLQYLINHIVCSKYHMCLFTGIIAWNVLITLDQTPSGNQRYIQFQTRILKLQQREIVHLQTM